MAHSFKAWKDSITIMVMLVCYNSPSNPKYPILIFMVNLTADSVHRFDWSQGGRKQQLADGGGGGDMEGCK